MVAPISSVLLEWKRLAVESGVIASHVSRYRVSDPTLALPCCCDLGRASSTRPS